MSVSKYLKGKDLVMNYFDFFNINPKPKKDIDRTVQCKCSWKGKYRASRGYTNLQAHIISSHPEYTTLTDNSQKNQLLLSDCFYPSKVR